MKVMKTPGDFYEACRASAIMGTLQAGYTDFAYLGEVSERIIRKESLLGCSMTGMCDNPDIAFNPEILRNGANIIKKVNKEMAKKIGINPAARTTCIKPAGSSSCILGTSSGIHPAHSKRYFRRVQVNKDEKPQKYFAKFNPDAIEESVWSSNKTDNVITFLCETSPDAITQKDVGAVDLLKYVKLVQENWVSEGRNLDLCLKPYLQHNVSNTISVKDNEWDDITKYIYENRSNFTGISILPSSGDKIYRQAPFEKVMMNDEIIKTYGDGAVFSSGLIIHALQCYGDLFDACDAVLNMDFKMPDLTVGKIESQIDVLKKEIDKKLFVERAKKFARRYFKNDLQKMTYCLKDVNALKKWCDLSRTYKDVPWDDFYEKKNNVKLSYTVACSGGACELVRM
jgi:ribonucleoside-diphosphate reductase alpha chain